MLLGLWCKFGSRLLNDLCRHRRGFSISMKMNLLFSRSTAFHNTDTWIFSCCSQEEDTVIEQMTYSPVEALQGFWWSKCINIWMLPAFPCTLLLRGYFGFVHSVSFPPPTYKDSFAFADLFFSGFCWWLRRKEADGKPRYEWTKVGRGIL